MHLLLIARRNRRHGAAMKGIFEGDQFKFMFIACRLMIGARRLDRAFASLCARIGEEHRVGKGRVYKPLGKGLPLRAAIEV